jgi:hypothetical protein
MEAPTANAIAGTATGTSVSLGSMRAASVPPRKRPARTAASIEANAYTLFPQTALMR